MMQKGVGWFFLCKNEKKRRYRRTSSGFALINSSLREFHSREIFFGYLESIAPLDKLHFRRILFFSIFLSLVLLNYNHSFLIITLRKIFSYNLIFFANLSGEFNFLDRNYVLCTSTRWCYETRKFEFDIECCENILYIFS